MYPFTYKYIALNKKPPIMKQNLHIFFFVIGGVECTLCSLYLFSPLGCSTSKTPFQNFSILSSPLYLGISLSTQNNFHSSTTGWPWHRENREFGCQFFQTGKTQGIWLQHREKIENTGKKIFDLFDFYFLIFSLYYCFCLFRPPQLRSFLEGRGSIVVLEHCTKNQ